MRRTRLAHSLHAFVLALALIARNGDAGEAEETQIQVHIMLRAVVRAAESYSPGKTSEAELITDTCISEGLQEAWRQGFEHAVDSMLQKSRRSMQRGLREVAEAFVKLSEGVILSCGRIEALETLKSQAERLNVLASTRSLGNLDTTVKYEPLKLLVVGDNDIHVEVNQLIAAFKLNRGDEQIGSSLAEFLRDFREDASTEGDDSGQPPAPPEEKIVEAPPIVTGEKEEPTVYTPAFWAEVLNQALTKAGGGHVLETCLSLEAARRMGNSLDDAFKRMMEKTKNGMRKGLHEVSQSILTLLDSLGEGLDSCKGLGETVGIKYMRNAASRLDVFASAKTLVNYGVHVEYEPMRALKVGGVDIHKELNSFILAWLRHKGAKELGNSIIDFLDDFLEQEAAEELEPKIHEGETEEETELLHFLRDAVANAGDKQGLGSDARTKNLPKQCFPVELQDKFASGVEGALVHMLQKRKRTMQQGLKELADATHLLLDDIAALPDCKSVLEGSGAKTIQKGSRKVRKLTRRTVVDYGTHIQYEAMKSLVVGKVPVHTELNSFIAAWKLRSRREAGIGFGDLMKKCASIEGHDEL